MMKKIWLNRYQQQVPAEINPDIYPSLNTLFEHICKKFCCLPALSFFNRSFSYQEWIDFSQYLAAYLQKKLFLSRGARVALMLPNCPQYMISIFGVLQAGLVVTSVNPLYTPAEFARQINHAQAEALILLRDLLPNVAGTLKETTLKYIITTGLGDMLRWPWSWLVTRSAGQAVKTSKKQEAVTVLDNDFLDCLKIGRCLKLTPIAIQPEEVAFLQYTGGTTGLSKAAMLTHRNILANVEQLSAWVRPILREGQEVIITALPLYHVFSLMVNGFMCLRLGGNNVLIPDPRKIRQLIRVLRRTHFSVLLGVNTLFKVLLKYRTFAKLNFSTLKISLGGGALLEASVKEHWKRVTGKLLLEGYGLTEASPVVCAPPWDLVVSGNHVGLPLPSTDVCLRDTDRLEVKWGEVGELCVKGPQVMKGYWMHPADAKGTLTEDGWLFTGDLARFDHQGFVFIVGRKKELILVSGFNVYPSEIEQLIEQHPKVQEAAVIGVPSEKTGETVKAFVVRKDDSLSENELLIYCRRFLTGYKLPKQIVFLGKLPKSSLGKIIKKDLK